MRELAGRTAVVTGAGSGIGRALAGGFAARGMALALADVDEPALAETARQIRAAGADVLEVPTDVRDPGAVDRLAARTVAEYGAVHVVCNNAGVSRMGRSWEIPLAEWHWVLEVNMWGVVHGMRSFVPHLLEQPEAHVVNTSSIGGLVSAPFIAPYTAAKHAVVGLSKSLRLELADRAPHVGVTVLCPGAVVTAIDPNTPLAGGEPESLPPEARTLAEHARRTKHEGMPPEQVAEMTLDAIRENRFYALPNADELMPLLRADHDEVLGAPLR
ncbi:SDR family NAD(P)-dependent oxidoreductase [Saccharopolyspora hattusasensis]|uniref:SDR family NAD(P)-dependent oxidoreductase n=1 Tax=Saccharopolyspora hattusasensis TaxID=1128679 RepID=UPI003D95E992